MRNEIGAERRLQTYLNRLTVVFSELKRVVRRDGVLWLIVGDAYTSGNRRYRDVDDKHPVRGMDTRPKTPAGLKAKDLIGLPWRLAFLLQELGWHLRTEIIWHKPNAIPESVLDRPLRNHEYIFMFSNGPKYYFDRLGLDASGAADRVQKSRSIWTVPVGGDSSGHRAAFPVRLVTPCVLSSSKKGDLILDPFAGSGSVGLSCIEHQRRFIGIDLNPTFIRLSEDRLNTAFGKSYINGNRRAWDRILKQKVHVATLENAPQIGIA